ncbi:hypothetical protein EW146_g5433 [Bondarzewia mesenterica]|uniref:ATP-dependent DNA helicase n=1 Tax=Bondarzewia mesenterica TaxID=1095465 RepID=A0A4S4LRH6_9AGAM|nr:hypothetical protein EW146_g5433 [Bondarzewia mesenterica]
MASCAYYFGPVGITGGRVEDPSKPRMHTFDAFLAVEELGESDINALLHVYVPSQDAVPDDGTYFICARFGVFAIQTGDVDVVGDSNRSDSRTTSSGVHVLQLFVSNTMKPLHGHGRFAGYAISCGKAECTPPDVMEERGSQKHASLAATLYDRGRTAHHLFGIPVTENNINLQSKISVYSHRADLIRAASVIIWDELPMANRATWECVDSLCRTLKHCDLPFGGIPFVGLGDFRQVAPVIPNGGPTAILHASVKSSALWRSVTIYQLTTPIRTAEDPQYSALIDDISEDTTHNEVSLAFLRSTTSVDECLDFLYPSHVLPNATLCFNRAFLSPLHTYVDEFNATAPMHPSYYRTTSLSSNTLQFPHTSSLSKLAPFVQSNATSMSTKKLVHNARVEVVALRQRSIDVRVIGSDEIHSLPRILFSFNPPYSSWTVNRRQFPLRIAYATTFNSCLSLTLDHIVVDIRTSIFAHGQLYTALSRVRKQTDVLLLMTDNYNGFTTNVVYRDLLL